MFILTVILGVLLAAMFLMSGAAKLAGQMDEMRDQLGLSDQIWKLTSASGILAGIGVLVGLIEDLAVIGVLAGIGLAIQMGLATGFHVKRGDTPKDTMPAVMSLAMAVAYVIFRIASA